MELEVVDTDLVIVVVGLVVGGSGLSLGGCDAGLELRSFSSNPRWFQSLPLGLNLLPSFTGVSAAYLCVLCFFQL